MLETIAAIIGIAGGAFGLYKGGVEWKRKRVPQDEKDERLQLLEPKLANLEKEKGAFDRIRQGEHLKPTRAGGERVSLTTLPFEIIKERAEDIIEANPSRYRKAGSKVIEIVETRGTRDLKDLVDELEPHLNKFIAKIKKEVRSLKL